METNDTIDNMDTKLKIVINKVIEYEREVLTYQSVCLFLPLFFLFVIIILVLFGINLIEWPLTVFLIITVFVVVYISCVSYRVIMHKRLDKLLEVIRRELENN